MGSNTANMLSKCLFKNDFSNFPSFKCKMYCMLSQITHVGMNWESIVENELGKRNKKSSNLF